MLGLSLLPVAAAGAVSADELRAANAAPGWQTLIQGLGNRFGGSYIDRAQPRATLVVEVVGGDPSLNSTLRDRFPYPDQLHVVQVIHSYDHLLALVARIASDEQGLRAQGIDVIEVGPDIPRNVVRVGVVAPTEGVAAELAQRYGAGWIETRPALPDVPVTDTSSKNPYRRVAGVWILVGVVLFVALVVGSIVVFSRLHSRSKNPPPGPGGGVRPTD